MQLLPCFLRLFGQLHNYTSSSPQNILTACDFFIGFFTIRYAPADSRLQASNRTCFLRSPPRYQHWDPFSQSHTSALALVTSLACAPRLFPCLGASELWKHHSSPFFFFFLILNRVESQVFSLIDFGGLGDRLSS